MSAILQARDVSKRFGGLLAVSQLSFEVAEGEIPGLRGIAGDHSLVRLGTQCKTGGQCSL